MWYHCIWCLWNHDELCAIVSDAYGYHDVLGTIVFDAHNNVTSNTFGIGGRKDVNQAKVNVHLIYSLICSGEEVKVKSKEICTTKITLIQQIHSPELLLKGFRMPCITASSPRMYTLYLIRFPLWTTFGQVWIVSALCVLVRPSIYSTSQAAASCVAVDSTFVSFIGLTMNPQPAGWATIILHVLLDFIICARTLQLTDRN